MMQCLCDIKTYINAQYSLSRTEINFYLTPEHNTLFLSDPNIPIKALCQVVGENPYENAFPVDIDINKVKTVGHLKDAIKEKLHPKFENVTANDIKLWKVDISLEKENKKLSSSTQKLTLISRRFLVVWNCFRFRN